MEGKIPKHVKVGDNKRIDITRLSAGRTNVFRMRMYTKETLVGMRYYSNWLSYSPNEITVTRGEIDKGLEMCRALDEGKTPSDDLLLECMDVNCCLRGVVASKGLPYSQWKELDGPHVYIWSTAAVAAWKEEETKRARRRKR